MLDTAEEAETRKKAKRGSSEEHEAVKALDRRFAALETIRSTWLKDWEQLAHYFRPRGFRRTQTDTNKASRKDFIDIINGRPIMAARTLAGGMMAGITSPSRPWFRLTVNGDDELKEDGDVKAWLADVEGVLRELIAQTNIYKVLPSLYEDIGPFGVSAMLVDEDEEDGARAYHFTLGTYCLAASARGDIDTLFRRTTRTVAQCIKKFGLERCSEAIRNAATAGRVDETVELKHAIFPNDKHIPGAYGAEGKPWLSVWWEAALPANAGFLRRAGYHEKPFMTPRWGTVGDDVYGHGQPGDLALGDARALQTLEKRKGQAAERIISPPMVAPSAAATSRLKLLPGQTDFVDALGANQTLRPAFEVNHQALPAVSAEILIHQERIDQAFYADLWLMLQNSEREMTAREVQERREEKLLQLGTVLESLQDELLDPLIDRIFAIALRQGRIPPAPEPLQGRPLKVEYISIMAAAQKLLATTGIERIATFAANLAAVEPGVLDKLDVDQVIDELADALGVPPSIIRSDEAVAGLRQARAKQAQQQQAVEQAAVGAKAAKDLGSIDATSDTALSRIAKGLGVSL
jgi:hypothetical protein